MNKIGYQVYDDLRELLPYIASLLSQGPTVLRVTDLTVLESAHISRQYMSHDEYCDSLVSKHGLDKDHLPFIRDSCPKKRHESPFGFGIMVYKCRDKDIKYAVLRCRDGQHCGCARVYFVLLRKDEKTFYKHIREQEAKANRNQKPPVLINGVLEDIIINTLGFLRQKNEFESHGVRIVRGVLLEGPPGNGKGMVCKWLKKLCIEENISWGTVTGSQIEKQFNEGVQLHYLFTRYTVTFLDDMDLSLMNRQEGSKSCDLFAAMDGIEDASHRIRIFTTNEDVDELDEAFVRPNRIDKVYHLGKPDASLRKKLVEALWPKVIRDFLNAPGRMRIFLDNSKGFSFADLEAIKAIMVRDKIQGSGEWCPDRAFTEFKESRVRKKKNPTGFNQ